MQSVNLVKFLLKPFCQIPGVFSLFANPLLRRMNLGGSGVIQAKIFKFDFEIDLNDYTQRRAWLGVFEKKEIRFLQQFLREGDIAIDAGANIGLLTIPMANAVSKAGRVLAFEPVPQNINQLQRNLMLNQLDNVTLESFALGETNKQIFLTDSHFSPDKSTGFFRLTQDENEGIEVQQITLKDALDKEAQLQKSIRLLKIDVEGMEEKVLVGLGEWLNPKSIEAILFETFIGPEGFSIASKGVLSLLKRHGYEICEIHSSGKLGSPNDLDKVTRRRDTTLNLVATTLQKSS